MERVTLSPVRRTPGALDRPIVAVAALSLPALAIAYALLRGDAGLSDDGAMVAKIGAAVAALVAGGLVAADVLRPPRLGSAGAIAAGALGVYAILAAVSVTWSISASASRDDAYTAFAYLAAYLAGATLVPALRRPYTTLCGAIGVLATLVSAWAIVARSFDGLTGVQLSARLTGSAGLPNVLAIIAVFGLLCGVALAAEADRRQRIAGGAIASLNACVILLTASRAGLLLGLIAAVTLLVLLDQRPLVRFGPLLAALPGALAGVFASTWHAFEARPPVVPHAGPQLLLLAAAASGLGALVAVRVGERLDRQPRRRRGITLTPRVVLLGVALLVALGIGAMIAKGGPSDTYHSLKTQVIEDVGQQEGVRQTSLSANQRDHWWRTAWDGFLDEPLKGYGAGTFRLLEQTTRQPAQPTGSPHNIVLQGLAGIGLAGGLLIAVAGAAMLVAAVAGVIGAPRGEEAAAAVLALGASAVLVQALLDVDWDAVGVGVIAAGVLGALASRGVIEERGLALRSLGAGVALSAAALAILVVPPWLAERDVRRSVNAESPQEALRLATKARDRDGLSVDALLAEADARAELDDRAGTIAALQEAVRLEPANYQPYLRQGIYEFSWGNVIDANNLLVKAYYLSGAQPSIIPYINDTHRAVGLPPWG